MVAVRAGTEGIEQTCKVGVRFIVFFRTFTKYLRAESDLNSSLRPNVSLTWNRNEQEETYVSAVTSEKGMSTEVRIFSSTPPTNCNCSSSDAATATGLFRQDGMSIREYDRKSCECADLIVEKLLQEVLFGLFATERLLQLLDLSLQRRYHAGLRRFHLLLNERLLKLSDSRAKLAHWRSARKEVSSRNSVPAQSVRSR
jgi:hypothetical protein